MRAACRREKPTRFVHLHLETFPCPDAEHGPLIGPGHLAPGFRQWCPRYCPYGAVEASHHPWMFHRQKSDCWRG